MNLEFIIGLLEYIVGLLARTNLTGKDVNNNATALIHDIMSVRISVRMFPLLFLVLKKNNQYTIMI